MTMDIKKFSIIYPTKPTQHGLTADEVGNTIFLDETEMMELEKLQWNESCTFPDYHRTVMRTA
jgi:hypothetical protein